MGYLIYPNVTSSPVSIVLSLFDLRQKTKLSEDFTLTWNSHAMPPCVLLYHSIFCIVVFDRIVMIDFGGNDGETVYL